MRFTFLLPDASIKTEVSPLVFLDRLAKLVEESADYTGQLKTSANLPGIPEATILSLAFKEHSHPKYQRGEIVWRDEPRLSMRVEVEARVDRWPSPENADYDTYASALLCLTDPLIQLYNTRYQTRRRLQIASEKSCQPKLSPRLKTYFKSFVGSVNRQTPSPSDMRIWYQFIHLVHRLRSEIDEEEIQFLLEREGFRPEDASDFVSVFTTGRNLLKTPCPPVSAKTEELMYRLRQPIS